MSDEGKLKLLEVQNFKSYAGHHVIGPFHDFTCVIGPNGSGKSNLMDAISFVVGIETKALRGTELRDLIYAGGSEAAEGLNTYVKLLFEVEDGPEIAFQRAISGTSSDYRIDGKHVSAERYTKELKKVGLHVKARNFLVFQNEIESIANKSPRDLTKLLERISGSEELEGDYEEAQANLQKAQEKSITEYKKRNMMQQIKKSFKEQQKEADKYLEILQELENEKLMLALFDLFRIVKDIDARREEMVEDEQALEKAKSEAQHVHDAMAAIEKEKAKAEKRKVTIAKRIEEMEKKIWDLSDPKRMAREQVKQRTKKLAKLKTEADKAKKDLETQKLELENLRNQLEVNSVKLHELEAGSARKDRLSGSNISEYNELKLKADSKTAALRERTRTKQSELEAKEQELQDHQERFKTTSNRLNTLTTKIESFQEFLKPIESELKQVGQAHVEVQAEWRQASNALKALEKRAADLRNARDSHQEKLAALKATRSESEFEERKLEAIAAMKRKFEGVHGRVLDLCKPRRREYQLPVMVALGKHAESIVVDKESTAFNCCQHLRGLNLRMTFLPLETISFNPLDESLRMVGGSTRLVIDVLEFKEEFQPALLHALGNTLLVNTTAEARRLCFDSRERKKVVTLDGTIVRPSGLMTGGGTNNQERAQKWDQASAREIKVQLRDAEDELKTVDRDMAATKAEVDSIAHRMQLLENQKQQKKRSKEESTAKLQADQKDLKGYTAEVENWRKTIAATESDIAALRAAAEEDRNEIESVVDEVFADLCKRWKIKNIREYEEGDLAAQKRKTDAIIAARKEETTLQSTINYQEGLVKELGAKPTALAARVAEEEDAIKQHQTELTKLDEKISGAEAEKESLKKDLDAASIEIREIVGKAKTHHKETKSHRDAIANIEARLSQKQDRIEALEDQRSSHLEECRIQQLKLPTSSALADDDSDESDAENTKGKRKRRGGAKERHNKRGRESGASKPGDIDFSKLPRNLRQASGDAQIDAARKELKDTIKNLALDLDKLNPNMKAGEQLSETKKELDDATAEFDAAKAESQALSQRFAQIKNRRFELFNGAFQHISDVINDIYKELTREAGQSDLFGGSAYLSCEDSAEPYLAGIKYDAIPPGKKFLEMDNLSGGEKAVSALALLFAIHSYRPSPFFVLDEVDAALDARNIEKATRYIRSRRGNLQCVVISLKEKFYDKADALVGICKEPKGGHSRCLTLDLGQFRE